MKNPRRSNTDAVSAFKDCLQEGRRVLAVRPATARRSSKGHWRGFNAPLNAACAHAIDHDAAHGGRFLGGLPFSSHDMRADGARLAELDSAEKAIVATLQDVRAEKEEVKLRIIERSGLVQTALDSRIRDPQTKPADLSFLQELAAEPRALVSAHYEARTAKGRLTRAKTLALAEENERLRGEVQRLRTGQPAEEETPAAPAGKTRRRSRR